jgi:hypothetical protein
MRFNKIVLLGPRRWHSVRWMKGSGITSRVTDLDSVLVWLQVSDGRGNINYAVTDTNGVGGFRSSEQTFVRAMHPQNRPHPIRLEQWPKSADKIAIQLFGEDFQPWLGRLVIDNPARSAIVPFTARPLPARERNSELELTLVALEA